MEVRSVVGTRTLRPALLLVPVLVVAAWSPLPALPPPDPAAAVGSRTSASADLPPGDTVRLTLQAAIDLALSGHPSLLAAEASFGRAASELRNARAARLPSVMGEASLVRYQDPMVVAPLSGFDPLSPPVFDRTLVQGSVSFGYTLWDGGARSARVRRATALTGAAGSEASAARQALIARTIRAYLRVLTAREVVAANEARIAAVAGERDRAAKFLDQGRAPRVMFLRAEAALATAEADAHEARGELLVAERDLARLLGRAPSEVEALDLAAVRPAAHGMGDRDAILARAYETNPDLARLAMRVVAAEAAEAEARSLWLPRVDAIGRFTEYAAGPGHERALWQGGVQLRYPFFTGGVRAAAGDRAHAERRVAEAALQLARLELASALDEALATLESERARVAALTAAVAHSEEVVAIERLALEAGAGVQSDYLSAEAELLRSRAALAAARAAEIGARVEVARLVGELDRGWIDTHLETGS